MSFVTVLMAVYNGARYLQEAIDSVLNQDLKDFEFLIIDDASTDTTPDILQKAMQADSRIRVLRNESNLGLARSLNRGLAKARGDLIARIDADDLCKPNRLAVQKQFLDAHQACVVLGSSAEKIDESGELLQAYHKAVSHDELFIQLFFRNPLTHSSVMFRRTVIQDLGGYDESFQRAQDYDLWLRCLGAGHAIDMLEKPLVSYRIHNARVTIRQADVLEVFRLKAVKRAYRDILELDVDDETLQHLEHLRLKCRPRERGKIRDFCRFFRSVRVAFSKRFVGNAEALAALERRLLSFVDYLAKEESCSANPYKTYITTPFLFPVLQVFLISDKLKYILARARFHLGALRRRYLSS